MPCGLLAACFNSLCAARCKLPHLILKAITLISTSSRVLAPHPTISDFVDVTDIPNQQQSLMPAASKAGQHAICQQAGRDQVAVCDVHLLVVLRALNVSIVTAPDARRKLQQQSTAAELQGARGCERLGAWNVLRPRLSASGRYTGRCISWRTCLCRFGRRHNHRFGWATPG